MYKITDKESCFTVTTQNGSTYINYTPSFYGKHLKIIQSVLVFDVSKLGSKKTFDVYVNNQIIDKINITNNDNVQKVCINITDEVNDALLNNTQTVNVELRNVSNSITKTGMECLNEYILSNQWLPNNAYQEVSVRRAGNLKINLATREYNLAHNDVTTKSKVLPATITHIFNSFNIDSNCDKVEVNGEDVQLPRSKCGNGWKLNCQQYLVKERLNNSFVENDISANYTYIKDDGSHVLFQEKYFYKNTNNEKVYLYPTQIDIHLDKTLHYTINGQTYDVESEIITDSDFNLVSKLEGFNGLELIDNDVEEIQNLKNQIQELQDALNSNELTSTQDETYRNLLTKRIFELNEYEKQIPEIFIEDKDGSIVMGFARFKKDSLSSSGNLNNSNDIYRLILIADKYENVIYIKYNDNADNYLDYKIDSVIDTDNNIISFKYDENDILKEIIDDKGNVLKFNYLNNNSNFYLSSTTYQNGLKSEYEYNTNFNISKIIDNSGYFIELNHYKSSIGISEGSKYKNYKYNEQPEQYKDDNGVLSDTSKILVDIDFYDYKSTTVTDRFNIQNNYQNGICNYKTYIFDVYGKPVTIYNGNFNESTPEQTKLNSLSYNYSDNKISKAIKKFNNSKNLLNVSTESYVGDNVYMGDDIYASLTETIDSTIYEMQDSNKIYSKQLNNSIIQLMTVRSGCFVFSAWAKADSAYINKYEDLDSYNEIENVILSNLDSSKKARKFELRVEIKYSGEDEMYYSSSSFDWMQTEWQYCEVPIILDKTKTVENITIYLDYSENTGNLSYFGLSLKECLIETNKYDNNKLLIESHNSYYDIKTTYEYKDKKLKKTSFSYNDNEYVSENYYNTQGSLIKSIDYNGMVEEYEYNDKGIVVRTCSYNILDPTSKFVNTSNFDNKGVETGTIDEFGEKSQSYEYSENGNLLTGVIDKNGDKTVYGYNPKTDDLMSISTSVNDEENKNLFGYTLGLLTRISHNDIIFDYELDSFGKFKSISIDGKVILDYYDDDVLSHYHNYSYNNINFVRKYYDDQKRITQVTYNSKVVIEHEYDTNDNIISQTETIYDENNLYNYGYDEMGNKNYECKTRTGAENEKEIEIVTKYNKFNNVSQETITIEDDGILNYNYQYDDTFNNKLQSIELPNELLQSVEYDSLNRLNFINYGDKFSKQVNYVKRGEYCSNLVSSVRYGKNSNSDSYLKYIYDNKGNIVKILENGREIVRYSYDSLSRLIREDNKELKQSYFIEYDKGGNILRKRTCNYTIKSLDEIEDDSLSENMYIYPDSGWKDQLISFNGEECKYDEIGNPETYRGKNLTWGKVRNLEKIGTTINYKYNANGIRTSKKVNNVTTKFYLKGNKIVAQDDGNKVYFHYGVDGLVGFTYRVSDTDIREYYYKTDILGNIIGIYDESMNLIVKYIYDAWGNHKTYVLNDNNNDNYDDIETTASNPSTNFNNNKFIAEHNPFRYRSYYYDKESKLYYLNSRYYDPETGRFINADDISVLDATKSVINGLNLYVYCMNNPVSYFDSNGYLPKWTAWLISSISIVGGIILSATGFGGILGGVMIGAGAGSLINGYINEANGGDFTSGYIGGAISGALCGIGSGLGGMAFISASEVSNIACIGYLALGSIYSFIGGFAGNMAGSIFTNWSDSGYKNIKLNLKETIGMSVIMGLLNILAGIGSGMSSIVGTMGISESNLNSKITLKILAGIIAGSTEAAYDVISYIINKLISI